MITNIINKTLLNLNLYNFMSLSNLIDESRNTKFGESETESLSTFLLCTAFENRFSPSSARIFRLVAMIITSPDILSYKQKNTSLSSFPEFWFDDENNILISEIDELINIIQYPCFGFRQDHTVYKYFLDNKDSYYQNEFNLILAILNKLINK